MSRELRDWPRTVAAALVAAMVPGLREQDRAALVDETAALLAELDRLAGVELGDGSLATEFIPDE